MDIFVIFVFLFCLNYSNVVCEVPTESLIYDNCRFIFYYEVISLIKPLDDNSLKATRNI